MTGSTLRSILLPLLAALVCIAARSGAAVGQDAPAAHHEEKSVESAVERGVEAATGGDVDMPARHKAPAHEAVDYNKPPLPGSAPGLGTLFVYSLILFCGFLVVARTMIWAPLIRALDEREGRINQAYAEAEKAKADAAHLLAAHETKMAEVHEQVKGMIAQARQQADAEKAQIIAAAEAEAKALRERALGEIRQAREEAMAGLLATVDRQVGLATEQVLGHRLN
ncbi:MAG: ATP synthase F0 subunit B [Planctomycetaceae bacterium]